MRRPPAATEERRRFTRSVPRILSGPRAERSHVSVRS